MGRPRLRPDEPGVGPRESETRAPPPAATPQTLGIRFERGTVRAGGQDEVFVDVLPAPADGVIVAISAPWAGQPVATVTLQRGTTAGQTTLVVPDRTAPGDYLIEAHAGATVAHPATMAAFLRGALRRRKLKNTPTLRL